MSMSERLKLTFNLFYSLSFVRENVYNKVKGEKKDPRSLGEEKRLFKKTDWGNI
jgi:hypothetical protein